MRRAFVVESSVSTLSSGLDPYFIPFLSILPIQVVLLIYLLLYLYLIVPMPFYLDEGESSWQYESQYVRERTLVLWRLVALAITGVGFTLGFLKYGPGCLIYGTTWVSVAAIAFFMLSAILSVANLSQDSPFSRLLLVIFECAVPSSITVTLLFWSAVVREWMLKTNVDFYWAVISHGVSSFLLIVDFKLTNTTFRASRIVYPLVAFFSYMIFNMVWVFSKGKRIYSLLSWVDPKSFAFLLVALLCQALAYFVFVYLRRDIKKFETGAPVSVSVQSGNSSFS